MANVRVLSAPAVVNDDGIGLPLEAGVPCTTETPIQSALDNIASIFKHANEFTSPIAQEQLFVYDPHLRIGSKPVIATYFNGDLVIGQLSDVTDPEMRSLFSAANAAGGYVRFAIARSQLFNMQLIEDDRPSLSTAGTRDPNVSINYPALGITISAMTAVGAEERMRDVELARFAAMELPNMLPPVLPVNMAKVEANAEAESLLQARARETAQRRWVGASALTRSVSSRYVFNLVSAKTGFQQEAAVTQFNSKKSSAPSQTPAPWWTLPSFLAMAVPTGKITGAAKGEGAAKSDTAGAGGTPPLRTPTATPPGGTDVVDAAAMRFHAAPTLEVTDAARAAAAAEAGKATGSKPAAPVLDLPASSAKPTTVVTHVGRIGDTGTNHDAMTFNVTAAARAASGMTPQATLPVLLLKGDLQQPAPGTATFKQAKAGGQVVPLVKVDVTAATGFYRFSIGNDQTGNSRPTFDGVNLRDPKIAMNQAAVLVDVDKRAITVLSKADGTRIPAQTVSGEKTLGAEGADTISMGYHTQLRLRFGNSFVDVTLPHANPDVIRNDFKGRVAAAEAARYQTLSFTSFSSMPLMQATPVVSVDGSTVRITTGAGSARAMNLEMPATLPTQLTIELVTEALRRINLGPVRGGNATPVSVTVKWIDAKEFGTRVKTASVAEEDRPLLWGRGIIDVQNGVATITVPDRFMPSPYLSPEVQQSQLKWAANTPVPMELRQLSVALDLLGAEWTKTGPAQLKTIISPANPRDYKSLNDEWAATQSPDRK